MELWPFLNGLAAAYPKGSRSRGRVPFGSHALQESESATALSRPL